MKNLLMLVLASSFVSFAAQAGVGQNETAKTDCKQVKQQVEQILKEKRASTEAPVSAAPVANPNSGSAE